jgi:hypothetical protein
VAQQLTLSGMSRAFTRVTVCIAIWAAFLAANMLHVYLRGEADNVTGAIHSPAGLEQALFRVVPSVWLQQHVSTDALLIKWSAVLLHASWFYVPIALAVSVQLRAGPRALAQLLGLHAVLLFASDAVYAVLPTSPPWMEFDVVRVVDVAWGNTSSVDANQVAALPSLHVAVPALYAIWFARRPEQSLRRLAPALGLWTLGVSWSVVYGGEHYVVDALAGACWALAIYAGTTAIARGLTVLRRRAPLFAPARGISSRARPLL